MGVYLHTHVHFCHLRKVVVKWQSNGLSWGIIHSHYIPERDMCDIQTVRYFRHAKGARWGNSVTSRKLGAKSFICEYKRGRQ